jgi:lipopolysaccharide transport system ATP-binding protein
MSIAVRAEGIAKRYRLGVAAQRPTERKRITHLLSAPIRNLDRLRRLAWFGEADEADVLWALRDISFEVQHGEVIGIVGHNGSGKSTLLKILSRITTPSMGEVEIVGRVGSLLEVGTGFHGELTGRENIFLNGSILGMDRAYIQRRFDEIVEFAELRDFIDAPVKTYSSGMYMRLGFAVAIHVDPDVLLVDEVLAVGDEGFTHKCLDKFGEFRRRGKTILLVTHSLGFVERFCDEVLWLDGGRAKATGDARRVVAAYITEVERGEERQLAADDARRLEGVEAAGPPPPAETVPQDPVDAGQAPDDMFRATEGRWGSREVEISGVELIGQDGEPAHVFHSGEPVRIRFDVSARQPVLDFAFGVGIFNAEGLCCYGTNTGIEEMLGVRLEGEGHVEIVIDRLDLVEGTYKLDVAVHRVDGYPYDYHRLLYTFRVKSRVKDVGVFRPPHRWTFSPNIQLRSTAP